MESEFQHRHHHLLDRHQNQQKQMSSGLTRYQSAPSSYFSTFFDRVSVEDFLNRPASPEIERNFEMCLSAGRGGDGSSCNVSASEAEPQKKTLSQIGSHASVSPNFYQRESQQRLPPNPRTAASTGVDRLPPMRTGGGNPNLVRHLSSPAGLFANLEIDIESFLTREMDHGTNTKANAEAAFRSSSRPPMSPRNVGDLSARFPTSSWNETLMPESIRGAKRLKEEDRTLSGPSVHDDVQKGDQGNRPPLLAHHLSLPKTSSEMSDLEKLLLFQDSVPCKIRAKRGFATHPRSIAERVRRTKISERMRKLQVLVPNMDKQTSTSDMLDLAVEYIKDLQNQVKVLSNSQARCTCCYQQQQQ